MRITSSVEYATRLMMTLAREHGKAPVPAERLAELDNVPADFVSQLLVKLRRAELVVSHRGSAGGYALSRKPADITLGQVVRAVDGAVFEEVCERYEQGARDCRHQGHCSISSVWRGLGDLVTGYFDAVRLSALLEAKGDPCGALPSFEKLIAQQRGS